MPQNLVNVVDHDEEKMEQGDNVEVNVQVKDGGMKLVRILTPDFRWQSGNADIELRLTGQSGDLALEGGLHASKATISSPFLKYPLTNTTASINLADNVVNVRFVFYYFPDSAFTVRLVLNVFILLTP